MLFKSKNFDYEINTRPDVDLCFWSILFQVCYVSTPVIGRALRGGGAVCFRFLCFGVAIEWWKWAHETVDVGTSIEEMLDEK